MNDEPVNVVIGSLKFVFWAANDDDDDDGDVQCAQNALRLDLCETVLMI